MAIGPTHLSDKRTCRVLSASTWTLCNAFFFFFLSIPQETNTNYSPQTCMKIYMSNKLKVLVDKTLVYLNNRSELSLVEGASLSHNHNISEFRFQSMLKEVFIFNTQSCIL